MANEFIIRKGYKSLAASEITGSLKTTGNITVGGDLMPTTDGGGSLGKGTGTNLRWAGLELQSGAGIQWQNGDARIIEGLVNNYSLSFQTYDGSTNSTALRLDGNNNANFAGRVGINTDPASGVQLHVNGEIRVDSTDGVATRKIRSSYFSSTTDIRVEAGSAGDVILGDNAAARLTLASDDTATFAGTVTAATTFIADAVDATNSDPGTDNVRFSGYGMIGNRGNLYVTNFNSSGTVQIGVGGAHNAAPKISVGTTNTTFHTGIRFGADSSYNIGTSTTRAANIFTDAISVLGTGTFDTINTGQGATEVHLMNQNLRTTDDVTFPKITVAQGTAYANGYRLTRSGHDTYRIGLGNSEGLRIINETDGAREELAFDGAGNAAFVGDVTVAGTLTAQEFKTELISASIVFESGSTIFGNSSDDTHVFTGSITAKNTVDGDYTGLRIMNQKTYGSGTGTNETARLVLGIAENGQADSNREGFVIETYTAEETDSSNINTEFKVRDGGAIGTAMKITGANKNVDFYNNVNLQDNKMLMWGGNSILRHTGTATEIGDNSSSSTISISGGATTFANDINLSAGQVKLRGDDALDHDGSSLYIKAPSLIYFYPGNANKGNINTSGTLTLSGGVSASSGTGHFSLVNASAYQLNGTYIVDSSRNLVNIGSITTGNSILISYSGNDGAGIDAGLKIMNDGNDWGAYIRKASNANFGLRIDSGGGNAISVYSTTGGSTKTFNVNGGNGNTDIAGDLQVGTSLANFEAGFGVAIGDKNYNYGAEFQATNASIQIVLGRNNGTSVQGRGAIGADATNAFAVWNTTSTSRKFEVTHDGNTTIAGDLTVTGGDISLSGTGRIQGIDTVSAATDAANKAYVDANATGISNVVEDTSPQLGGSLDMNGKMLFETDQRNSIDLVDHSSYTWLRNAQGGWVFQQGTAGDNWTLSYAIFLPAGNTAGNNDQFIQLGQRASNATNGSYKGTRIVQYKGGVVDGQLKASLGYFSGDTVEGVTDTHNAGIFLSTANRGIAALFGSSYARNLIRSDGSATIEIGDNTSLISLIKLNAGSSSTNGVVSFMTKGSERMRVHHDGTVGIGVTSPTSPLTVKSNSVSAQTSGIAIQANGSTDDIIRMGEKSTNGGRLHMFDGGTEKIAFYTDGTNNHISAGNVGIGTSGPAAKLDVEAGTLGSTSGDTKTAAIIRAGRQNIVFKDTRTANGSDWNNATFKIIAQIDSTDHQSIDFVNDSSYAEHIDIRTGNQVFHSRFTAAGRLGIGTTSPGGALHVYNGGSERFLIDGDVKVAGSTDLMITGASRRLSFTNGSGTIRTTTGNSLILQTNNADGIVIDGSTQNVSMGSTSKTASNNYVLDVKKAYSSGNGHVAYFGAGSNTIAKLNFDTVVVGQDDVPCLAIVEGNNGNSHSTEQALRLAVGDNNAVISTSNTSGGLHFFVNRGTNSSGYLTNTGTKALYLLNNGNVNVPSGNLGIGTDSPSYKLQVQGTGYFNSTLYVNGTTTINDDLIIDHNIIGNSKNFATSNAWASGSGTQTGYYGGNFSGDSQGIVKYDVGPFGARELIQETVPDSGNDYDGGWNKTITELDINKAHMSVVYVRRTTSQSSGNFYHGTGVSSGQIQNLNGTNNTNPYFQATGVSILPQNVWCVSIGIIQANHDTNSTTSGQYNDRVGIYRLDTGQKLNTASTYKFGSSGSTLTNGHRTFLYYSTDNATKLQFARPGFYEMNGDAPTFESLVGRPVAIQINQSGVPTLADGVTAAEIRTLISALRKDADDTTTGNLTVSNSAPVLHVSSTSGTKSTLRIGRTADTQAEVTAGDQSSSDLCFRTGGNRRVQITSGGQFNLHGNFIQDGGRTFLSGYDSASDLNSIWQTAGTGREGGINPFRFQSNASNAPGTNNNANWGLNIYSHAGSGGGYPYGIQLAGSDAGSGENSLQLRTVSNGTFSSWKKVFHEGHLPTMAEAGVTAASIRGLGFFDTSNDGAGSGLDADKLDGMQPKDASSQTGAEQILRSAANGYFYHKNWIDVAGAGLFSTTVNGAHLYPNAASDYGTWRMNGTRGGYNGLVFGFDGNSPANGLIATSTTIGLFNDTDNEWLLKGTHNQGVQLYYNNGEKLKTTSAGVDVTGNVTHDGLSMTSGTDIDQLTTVNMTYQLAANTWTDTGINSSELATGTYAIQLFVDDHNAGGGHYDVVYSGMMSWYGSNTNSSNFDEIVLHRVGHATNNSIIQLRTLMHANGGDNVMLQVKQNFSHSAAMSGTTDGKRHTFKFRRLI